MTAIKQLIISSLPVIFIAGCIEPNTEDLWSVSVDQILQTNGYARDVSIDNDVVFIAAGEAGAQIWDINNSNNEYKMVHFYNLLENNILNLVFLVSYN